ncbi:ankyrin repeat protein [Podospora australis]|uniref:Ankyrin repeat protein n=1 Tax=Podospora australis TaxID=1536484 RepID=A0AAN6WKC3_9PEZI|nr:ankyrin repeat protein [Podospora australis]
MNRHWSSFLSSRRKPGGEPDYGLHVLVPSPRPASDTKNPTVDIVAIHGLNGDYLTTWTDKNSGVNWLVDILPICVAAYSRVMSFSYNSSLQFSKSAADVSTFAHQLLESLLAERKTKEERNRPVIFICHSLGGLVFKRAYLLADESQNYAGLRKKIKGVMFFGTPHRGSSVAGWATMAARVLAASSLRTSTNTRLSKDLEPGSEKLRYISESFRYRALRDRLQIVSCYETEKLGFMNTLVVDRESAVLELPEIETVIPVQGDHRSICRFLNVEANRFKPVAARIQELSESAVKSGWEEGPKPASKLDLKDMQEELVSVVTRLDTTDYAAHRARNPVAIRGTCQWVVEHPKFEGWLSSSETPLLWISGDPGCGKSVLASFLVERLTEMSKTTRLNVCYFFCKADDLAQSNPVRAIQSLLHQLLTQRSGLVTTADYYLRKDNLNLEDINNLWSMLVLLADRDINRRTICILDGIDECEPKSRKQLLGAISGFLHSEGLTVESQATNSSAIIEETGDLPLSGLKIIVTSRPENQIKVAFEKMPRATDLADDPLAVRAAMIRLRGEDETDAISQDVTTVIKSKINDLIESGLPPVLMETVQDKLIARADRTFLWVSLILGLLEEKVEAGASRRELDDVLNTREIFDIYTRLLESRSNSPRARKMLSIILAATRALTLDEISVALAVPPQNQSLLNQSRSPLQAGTLSMTDIEYDMVLPAENHVKSLCGHFVRIIREKVYLVHETAREFLLVLSSTSPKEQHRLFPAMGGSTSPVDANVREPAQVVLYQHSFRLIEARALLLEICVTYLYSLAQDLMRTGGSESTAAISTKPFLRYVAHSWTVHFRQIKHRLYSEDLWYFHGLCHPLFPAFKSWTEEYRPSDGHGYHYPTAVTDDAVQDFYITRCNLELRFARRLKNGVVPLRDQHHSDADSNDETNPEARAVLEHSSPDSDDVDEDEDGENDGDEDTNDDEDEDEDPLLTVHATRRRPIRLPSDKEGGSNSSLHGLYSNPTSLPNHRLPLRVDAAGMLSLDFAMKF